MPQAIRTAPVTSADRRRAARSAFLRSSRLLNITSGQRRAILDGRSNGRVNGSVDGRAADPR